MTPRAVGIIIENKKGEILLLKRSANVDHEQGKWENIGGKVEENENFEQAAHREVMEELGCKIGDLELLHEYTPQETGKYQIQLFKTNIIGTPEIKEPSMCDQIGWFSKKELKNLDLAKYTQSDFKFLGWIANGI